MPRQEVNTHHGRIGQVRDPVNPRQWRQAYVHGKFGDVRFGSKADVTLLNFHVRFTPESGHSPTRSGCLLWAISGLMHRSKICLYLRLELPAPNWAIDIFPPNMQRA